MGVNSDTIIVFGESSGAMQSALLLPIFSETIKGAGCMIGTGYSSWELYQDGYTEDNILAGMVAIAE